jgi:anti-sigma regulatory factor (Ser/Thr protein kinase)
MPVVEKGKLVGVISTEDIITTLERGKDVAVREKIGYPMRTCFADEPLAQAIRRFDMYGYGRYPVENRRGRLVGIITRGDIIHGLLRALEVDYHEEEILKHEASYLLEHVDSERTRLFLSYRVKARDFAHAGDAARQIKRALVRLGAHPQSVRRVAVSAFEAETNIIIHSNGGRIAVLVQPSAIRVRATDTGPGIPDVDLAMQPGFSTAPDWVREMGFGSGMGLANIRRCASTMHLTSIPGRKTCLEYTVIPEKSIALREQLKRRQNDFTRNRRPIIVNGKNRSAQVDEPG